MLHSSLASLVLVTVVCCSPLIEQNSPAQEPSDLNVELRSATGSNRFQIGERIPLEVVLSSSAPFRYLEPCSLFDESHFGSPRCRFGNRWKFAIVPDHGWIDRTTEFPPRH